MFGGGELNLTMLLIFIGVLLVSMTIHEATHAFVGYKLGDDTAADEGRITLNPLKHIDPFLTVLLPAITLFLFGAPILAAKPVPFDPERVRFEEFGAAMIAIAGPLSNLALAALTVVTSRIIGVDLLSGNDLLSLIMLVSVTLNVGLFVFNILPIPPLDGSRVLYAFAPEPLQRFMQMIEPYGLFIVIGIVMLGGFSKVLITLNQAVLNFLL